MGSAIQVGLELSRLQITPARLHDSTLARNRPIDRCNTYVFDRAYNGSAFWKKLDDADCSFVTRAKSNLLLDVIERHIDPTDCIIFDDLVELAGSTKKKYQKPLHRKARIKAPLKRLMSLAKNTLYNQNAIKHLLNPKKTKPPDFPEISLG